MSFSTKIVIDKGLCLKMVYSGQLNILDGLFVYS